MLLNLSRSSSFSLSQQPCSCRSTGPHQSLFPAWLEDFEIALTAAGSGYDAAGCGVVAAGDGLSVQEAGWLLQEAGWLLLKVVRTLQEAGK